MRRFSADELGKLGLAGRIHAPGRLVEDQDVWVGDEHRGECEPLALAAREVARVTPFEPRETDLGERAARQGEVSSTASATSSSARSVTR